MIIEMHLYVCFRSKIQSTHVCIRGCRHAKNIIHKSKTYKTYRGTSIFFLWKCCRSQVYDEGSLIEWHVWTQNDHGPTRQNALRTFEIKNKIQAGICRGLVWHYTRSHTIKKIACGTTVRYSHYLETFDYSK